MNKNNFKDRINPSDDSDRTDQDQNDAIVNANPSTMATLIQETPMGEGAVTVDPADDLVFHDVPLDEKIRSNVPNVDALPPKAIIGTDTGSVVALISHEESEHLRTLWNEVQGKFVDEPRSAVQQADALVSDVIKQITQIFANEHRSLEEQWKEGKDVSTEDLRKALQHYRSFFNRLVV